MADSVVLVLVLRRNVAFGVGVQTAEHGGGVRVAEWPRVIGLVGIVGVGVVTEIGFGAHRGHWQRGGPGATERRARFSQ